MLSRVLIIPAFNEAASLPGVLRRVAEVAPDLHCVVVDDGSRDDTAAIARRSGAIVIQHPFNLGYGAAIQTGYKYALARGVEQLVQMDADGQHDPADIPKLLAPIEDGSCDLVIGSRFAEPTGYAMGFSREFGRRLFGVIAGRFGLTVTDPTSGFQAMNRKVIAIYAEDFFPSDYPDVDVLVRVHRYRLRIREVSVRMRAETRRSRIHGGLRSVYYFYKMILSLWVASSSHRSTAGDVDEAQREG